MWWSSYLWWCGSGARGSGCASRFSDAQCCLLRWCSRWSFRVGLRRSRATFVVSILPFIPSRGRHPPPRLLLAIAWLALLQRGRLSSTRAIALTTTTTTQRQRRSRHRRLSTRVRLGLPRCNTRANQQRGRNEDLPGPTATLSRISSRARQRASRFRRPGSLVDDVDFASDGVHSRARTATVEHATASRRSHERGVLLFVSRLGMASDLRVGPARHAARVPSGSRASRLFVVRLTFPSAAARSPDVASLVSRLCSPWIDGHATPGLNAQSRRRVVTPGSQQEPVLRDMETAAATHGCGFGGSSRRDRVRVASALAARLVGISRRRRLDLVDAVARVSCGGGLGGSSATQDGLRWHARELRRHFKISRRYVRGSRSPFTDAIHYERH